MNDDRQMYSGDWTCKDCNGAISELPFEPRSTDNLQCRDCHMKTRDERGPRPQRQMHQGNWSCADCGGEITELPFEPRDTSNLKCRDCFRK